MIPEAAFEAAVKAWGGTSFGGDALWNALEAAAPHMLSHEREETRLAHLDAVVNARTVDKLNSAIKAVLEQCNDMDLVVEIRANDNTSPGDYRATRIRAAITKALQ